MADGVSHGQHSQTERQCHAEQADADVRKGGGQHGAAAAPSTSQKVPMNSAAKVSLLNSPNDG